MTAPAHAGEDDLHGGFSRARLRRVAQFPLAVRATFDTAEHLRVGYLVGGRRIYHITRNFQTHFGSVVETVDTPERDLPRLTGMACDLAVFSRDRDIVNELGGEQYAQMRLAHVFETMQNPDTCATLVDGRVNIGYRRSPIDRRLWAVVWLVRGGEWGIGAALVPREEEPEEGPEDDRRNEGWDEGRRIFSSVTS